MDTLAQKFINLTPHDVRLVCKGEGDVKDMDITFPASGTVARCTSEPQVIHIALSEMAQVPIFLPQKFIDVVGLPEDTSRQIIVSQMVAEFMHHNNHTYPGLVVFPDTGPTAGVKRDERGQIAAVTRFCSYAVLW
jgi:hypothetical protein